MSCVIRHNSLFGVRWEVGVSFMIDEIVCICILHMNESTIHTYTVWTKVKWNAKQACFARIDGHFWRMANQRE